MSDYEDFMKGERMDKTFTMEEILRACESYADGERFDIGQFLHILEHPEEEN